MIGIRTDKKIKVLIVDDSPMVRRVFTREISKDPLIEVVGTAPDPYVARDKIVELSPDVLLLDIEMPRMDGITFLEKLMKYYPMPVIIVSSIAQKGCEVALRALELGAAEVMAKPSSSFSLQDMGEQLIEKIKAVSTIKSFESSIAGSVAASPIQAVRTAKNWNRNIILIGASTGGTEAIKEILTQLPAEMPPILIVQHMPQHFTKSFADRLNSLCRLDVKEAEDREIAVPGKVLIAPGNRHMVLKRNARTYFVEIKDGPLVHHQRPAVDVLFTSGARYAGADAVGVLLTGMGKDGAKGLFDMKEAGAFTIAQDEKSCVVYGMPKEAVLLGAVMKTTPLAKIPQTLMDTI